MDPTEKSFEFLAERLKNYKSTDKPLIIGVSGPQGSGKTWTSERLTNKIREAYPDKLTINFSMDDFYLTHEDQQKLTISNPGNSFLSGRGLPGTHDLEFLNKILHKLLNKDKDIIIPRYQKGAFSGEGDRCPENEWQDLTGKSVDIIVFEGWFNGYLPYDNTDELLKSWNHIVTELKPTFKGFNIDHIIRLNNDLEKYVKIWKLFDTFIFMTTDSIDNVYTWRIQQEHNLISEFGTGMTDDQVTKFVDRYMPVYYLSYYRLEEKDNFGVETLKLCINLQRQIVSESQHV
ncbi:catalytic activity protein [[Candida] boidinii]|uniref:Unnamed protein product n=1 Tax=Candida boidinii TaxID=5477 RepID=A0ACB5TR92_CANBO|nr:catalytic activity protein [[Candida] boidinii]OWB60828.1 catalytic activity protein [[Candida] boidinii]OWB73586.1 catalytic activity protein [[Candida] boidinii]GME93234.1 unnamed protein product [[Candida] boidinii]